MSRQPRQRGQRSLALDALQTQIQEPAHLRRHPVGENRYWPRKWAYALDGLRGDELERELEHVPEHLREMVRFYVVEYLPRDRTFARARERARANLQLSELHHERDKQS